LAYEVGCDKSLIEAVEMNLKPPPGALLGRWADAIGLSPETVILCYINQQAKKMCLEAGIAPLFKVVEADWDRDSNLIRDEREARYGVDTDRRFP
jgi:hypothetical protein